MRDSGPRLQILGWQDTLPRIRVISALDLLELCNQSTTCSSSLIAPCRLSNISEILILNNCDGFSGYMAPEYIVYGQLTEKADVYAYGVVVLEIITGRKNHSSPAASAEGLSLTSLVIFSQCNCNGFGLNFQKGHPAQQSRSSSMLNYRVFSTFPASTGLATSHIPTLSYSEHA